MLIKIILLFLFKLSYSVNKSLNHYRAPHSVWFSQIMIIMDVYWPQKWMQVFVSAMWPRVNLPCTFHVLCIFMLSKIK